MILARPNKPMPESPKIVATVTKAWEKSNTDPILIPWSDFVFSTRDGKVFMPPMLAKGIAAVKKGLRTGGVPALASPLGVFVRVFPVFMGASFDPNTFAIRTSGKPHLTRHETLHFVQAVGSNLILAAKGDPTAFTEGGLHARLGGKRDVPKMTTEMVKKFLRGEGFGVYGGPKRRAATRGKGIGASAATAGVTEQEHALLDAEFQTDAMDVASHTVMTVSKSKRRPTGPELATMIVQNRYATMFVTKMEPVRKRDFLRTAYQRAAEMLGMPSALTSQVKAALGEKVAKEAAVRRKPAPVPAAPRPRTKTKPAPVPVAVAKKAPAKKATPAAPKGLHIRKEGREYRVYRGNEFTGKYGFSEEKAMQIMGRMRA